MSAGDAPHAKRDDRSDDVPSAASDAAVPCPADELRPVEMQSRAVPPNTPRAVDPTHPRAASWVVTTDVVFPHHANTMGTLFGGRALELLDINAAIACYRFARRTVVTASTEPIDFHAPVHVGEILEVRSRVIWTGHTSMIVRGELIGENPRTGERRLTTVGHMSFVALDDEGHPTAVPPLRIETDEERLHNAIGARVREHIRRRRTDGG